MRFVWGLAIAFCLTLPVEGTIWRQEPAAPETPTASVPAEAGPSKEKAAPEDKPQDKDREDKSDKNPSENVPAVATSNSSVATKKRHRHPAPTKDGGPQKVVVREGGAREPAAQIAPDITPAEASKERQNAEQLLASTDDHLKQLTGRTLDARQQESVGQIRNYMAGTRSALKEGDVRRASTLAQKAHLLAEDLVKH